MRAVLGVSDRIMVLNFGEKIAEGTPKEVSTNPQVIEAYLGKSYAARSLNSDQPVKAAVSREEGPCWK